MASADAGTHEPDWRKSSYSVNNGACVEVAEFAGTLMVADTAVPGRSHTLRYSARAWRLFVVSMKTGRSDESAYGSGVED
jgi:hypothetical protein